MDFIISGILHLQKAESENVEENIQGRELKYALLHLSSGIELVFKSIVVQLSRQKSKHFIMN